MTNHHETPAWVRNVKVGDKLVATGWAPKNAFWWDGEPKEPEYPLKAGSVHEVLEVMFHHAVEAVVFWVGDTNQIGGPIYRRWQHFRPVSKRSTETGMSILTSILDGASVRTGEGVE